MAAFCLLLACSGESQLPWDKDTQVTMLKGPHDKEPGPPANSCVSEQFESSSSSLSQAFR